MNQAKAKKAKGRFFVKNKMVFTQGKPSTLPGSAVNRGEKTILMSSLAWK
jgi:hypothetical protein